MKELLERYPALAFCSAEIEKGADLMYDTYLGKGKVLCCGNGGSAADCEHIVGELMKGFKCSREVCDERIPKELRSQLQGGLPAISLPSQTALLSAFANDCVPEMVYAQLVYGYAREGDLLIAISTSGNSRNVVRAAQVAAAMDVRILALTGRADSKLSEIADVCIKAPADETYRVQELHMPIYHWLCAEIEKKFFE